MTTMTNQSIAAAHKNEYVTVTHRSTGDVRERLLGVLLSEASEKQRFADADLDEDTITIGELRDFLCDYTIEL